jgi:hypothetical protein|nr:MAG TPA: hypothetical protein [Caudoviricetes sp.]
MSNITLTIPNDDHIALRAFGKALEEMALAHGAPLRVNPHADVEKLRETMENAEPTHIIPEVDTTAQQVESLGVTHIITEQKLVGDPVPVGDGNFSQGYVATVEEIADPVDSTGTPWDERIHSTSKALNADGTWRLRRKPKDMDEAEWSDYVSMIKADLQYPVECGGEGEQVDQEHYAAETAEGINDIEPPVTPPGDEESELQPPLYEIAPGHIGVMQDEPPVTPPLPVPPPVVVAPPVPEVTTWDFPRLMTFLTERHGKIDVATVNTLLAQDGMSSVQELNAHPDKIGPFVARVKAHLGE